MTKLSYLLSKAELSPEDVRKLMGTPLRGELTSVANPSKPRIDQNVENLQDIISHFIRLSRPVSSALPTILVSHSSLDEATQEAAASWSSTAAEVATTEAVLHPFLMHLAAAQNDTETIKFCLSAPDGVNDALQTPSLESPRYGNIAGGLANCLEPGSGRSPLHVAALNGSISVVRLLLESGGLVHLRDTLGHTPLYYVS